MTFRPNTTFAGITAKIVATFTNSGTISYSLFLQRVWTTSEAVLKLDTLESSLVCLN